MLQSGGITGRLPASLRPPLSPALDEALEIYNLMGGLEWSAIPLVFSMYRVTNPRATIVRLAFIRDAMAAPRHGKD